MSDDTAKNDGAAKIQESFDVDSAQKTTQQQKKTGENSNAEIKDEVDNKYENYKTSRTLFEECLKKSFSETGKQELIAIISNNFPVLGRKVSDHYEIDKLINSFIDHCASYGEFKAAWSVIKEKRPNWYNDFFPRWSRAIRQEEHIEYGYKDRQRNQQKQEDIVEWFFKLDDPVAQSMAITAALFQGVERNTFNELAHDIYKLLFPPAPEVQAPKNEPSSEENKEDSEQQKEKQVPPAPPQLKNELDQVQKAEIKFTSEKRNSDYGITDVEVVFFEYNNYQTELLNLIRNNLYSKRSALFEFIGSLIDDDSSEKRLFAINAVIALSETHLFQDLLDHIIRKWAKTENYYTHQATALSLSGILLKGRLENEILALLNSWLKTGTSMFLNITSMFTYYLIAETYPDQALQAVAHVSEKEDIIFSLKSLDIAFKVYQKDRSIFISYLYNWIKDDRMLLRRQAGIYFFRFIEIADAVTDQSSIEKTVEIIFNLWENSNIPMQLEVQEDTTSKVESWAKEALVAWENDDSNSFESYRKLFHDLYQKYEEECQKNKICRVNRLEYHLQRWEKRRIWELKRAEKRGALSNKQSSFDMLRLESA